MAAGRRNDHGRQNRVCGESGGRIGQWGFARDWINIY
jgi:hypothetical protein